MIAKDQGEGEGPLEKLEFPCRSLSSSLLGGLRIAKTCQGEPAPKPVGAHILIIFAFLDLN